MSTQKLNLAPDTSIESIINLEETPIQEKRQHLALDNMKSMQKDLEKRKEFVLHMLFIMLLTMIISTVMYFFTQIEMKEEKIADMTFQINNQKVNK